MMDIDRILELLPHRHPFLLVDRMLEVEPGVRGVGIKQVTATEPWVTGHFPGKPVMPGVLITEALAQAAALVWLAGNDTEGKMIYLVGVDKMRYRRPVRPGDTLRLEVEAETKRRVWTFRALATVDGQRVADGTLMATLA